LRAPLWLLGAALNLSAVFRTTLIWRQYREFELQREDQSNWFGPNRAAVIESFETAGFRIQYLDSWDYGARSTFLATAAPLPSRLTDATYEGLSSLHRHLTGIDREDVDFYRRDS